MGVKLMFLNETIVKMILRSSPAVHYINGADTLPPPLTTEEENELLERYYETERTDDAEHERLRNVLIERNLRLVVFLAKKFDNTGIGLEDLISIGTIGLIKAINTFRTDKNIKLATYASRCIENEILMYMRKNSGTHVEISIDEPLNVDWDGNELLLSDILGNDEDTVSEGIEKDEERKVISAALDRLSERERLIIRMRFGLGGTGTVFDKTVGKERTQKEVAELLGISQSYISRLEKRIIRELKSEIAGKL